MLCERINQLETKTVRKPVAAEYWSLHCVPIWALKVFVCIGPSFEGCQPKLCVHRSVAIVT